MEKKTTATATTEKVNKEDAVQEVWQKLRDEREMWRGVIKAKEKEKDEAIREIQAVSNMVLARVCSSFGHKVSTPDGEEYVLEIVRPKGTWAVKAAKLKSGAYELHAKKIEV